MNYMLCATCGEKFATKPPSNLWYFGHHLRGKKHQHGGIVDENDNVVKPPPDKRKLKEIMSEEEDYIPESVGGDGGKDNGKTPAKSDKSDIAKKALFKGQFVGKVITLDPRLYVLYDAFTSRAPDYKAPIEQWIWDCVIEIFKVYKDRLNLEGYLFGERVKEVIEEVK